MHLSLSLEIGTQGYHLLKRQERDWLHQVKLVLLSTCTLREREVCVLMMTEHCWSAVKLVSGSKWRPVHQSMSLEFRFAPLHALILSFPLIWFYVLASFPQLLYVVFVIVVIVVMRHRVCLISHNQQSCSQHMKVPGASRAESEFSFGNRSQKWAGTRAEPKGYKQCNTHFLEP